MSTWRRVVGGVLLAASLAIAGPEEAARLERFLAEAASAAVAGDRERAEFYVARYVGDALSSGHPIDGASLVAIGDRLGIRPRPMLSPRHDERFVDWFVASTYPPWSVSDAAADEASLSMVIAAGGDDRHFVQIVGSPALRSIVIPGETGSSMLHVVDGARSIYLNAGTAVDRVPDRFFPPVAIDTRGADVHSFHPPRFVDLDRDGHNEIVVRYTLLSSDSFSQVLEVHRATTDRLERVSAFHGGEEGFAQLTREGDVLVGRAVASRPAQAPDDLDRTVIERIRLVERTWRVVERFERPSVLRSAAFAEYLVERPIP